jgi:transcriptional regulator with XRE-family HTH domain
VQLDFLLNKSEATPKEFTWFCHTSSIDILEKIGYALMLQRYDRQITQKGLAKIMNTSPTVISKVENGKQNITFEYLTRFATALELPIRLEFLEGYTPFCIDIPCTYCKSPATGIELLKRFKDSASLEKQF